MMKIEMDDKENRRKLSLIEKIAIFLIVILVIVILLLFFNEQIASYIKDLMQWYQSG